jgi:hypothetical protein
VRTGGLGAGPTGLDASVRQTVTGR